LQLKYLIKSVNGETRKAPGLPKRLKEDNRRETQIDSPTGVAIEKKEGRGTGKRGDILNQGLGRRTHKRIDEGLPIPLFLT